MPNYDSDYEPSIVSAGLDDREWEEAMGPRTEDAKWARARTEDRNWVRTVEKNGAASLTVTLRRVKRRYGGCK